MVRFRSFIVVILLTTFLCPISVGAAGGKRLSATSDQLQALFVKRLVKYVSWPESVAPEPGEPFILAATNAKKFKPFFEGEGSSSNFKLVQWPVDDCHLLVVNGAPDREAAAIIDRVADAPILTIGQSFYSLRSGVVINFQMVDGRIRLQVNPRAADRAGLIISSKLLRIAKIYKGELRD